MSKRNVCVIYDSDEQYAKRLMNVINDSESSYNAKIFTRKEEFSRYILNNNADMLMINEDCYFYEVENNHKGKVVVLCEDENRAEGINRRNKEEVIGICKYQPSFQLLNLITKQNGKHIENKMRDSYIVGVYGFNATLRVILSILIARAFSEKGRTLFINLDEFSGVEDMLDGETDKNLADAIYMFKQSGKKFVPGIQNAICCSTYFDYIPGVACAEDVSYADSPFIYMMADTVGKELGYDNVVINISEGITKPWEMFEYCDVVYVADGGDYIENNRYHSMKRYFIESDKESITDKMTRINLRIEDKIDKDFIQRAEYTEAYEYVRNLIGR